MIYLFELSALCLILISVSLFYLNQSAIGSFFNSDFLSIPDIFHDLANHGVIKDWIIPSSPCFFPDWLIFFLATLLAKDIYLQFLFVACLNTALLYVVVRFLYGEFFGKEKTILFTICSIGIFLFFSLNLVQPYVLLFVLGFHCGGFIVGLFYVLIQLKLIPIVNNHQKVSLLLFFIILISLVMGLSDPLFVVQFSFPILFSFLMMYTKREISCCKLFSFVVIPLCFSLFGFALIPYLIPKDQLWHYFPPQSLALDSVMTNIKTNGLFILYSFKNLLKFSWLSYSIFIFYLTIVFFFIRNSFIKNNKKQLFFTGFIFFSLVITSLSFVLARLPTPTERYLLTLFLLPIVLFFYIDSFFKDNKLVTSILVISAFSVIIYLILSSESLFYKKLFLVKTSYYPLEIACIDKAISSGSIGIAQYWDARYITFLSKKNIAINSVLGDLTPLLWATNSQRYNQNAYDFAIIDQDNTVTTGKLDESLIIDNNRIPQRIVLCGNKKLLIYVKGGLKIPSFIKKGD